MNSTIRAAWLVLAAAVLAAPLGAETFQIDPMHSAVTFRVQHMMVSKVHGRFDKLSGTVTYAKANPADLAAEATIETDSINTGVEMRDKHLKSPDFFDAAKFPRITFKSTKVEGLKDGHGTLIGDLTMHGVTKPVSLALEIGGTYKDPRGEHFGATASGKLSRKDFGLIYNKALETGGVAIGDEIEIEIEVEGLAPAAAKKA